MLLDAVLFKDGETWVAQCLQHDIIGCGASKTDAITRLEYMFQAEVLVCDERGISLNSIPPAPPMFWELLSKKFEGVYTVQFDVNFKPC
jgi:hypothetical protein